MRQSIRIASLLAAAQLIAAPALAQSSQASSPITDAEIAGEWTFIANTGPECTFSGNALLLQTDTPSRFSCELTATQVCMTDTWQVRQSCTATQVNDQLVITSQIEEFVQGEPNGGYKPDNFKLTIKSADLMKGVLVSWGFHMAEFRRSDGTIS
ncbi:hypothetical protein [Ponticaulis profundi]|uniref:Lipocalin-like domain-containing protein n=1 Tax=Ponticaulis profundi TaxID=2665222 RepID=A0ABW1S7Q1_9PROT